MEKISRDNLFAAAGYYLDIKPTENEVEFIVGALPGKEGYLWVFPKSDHYNIGYCYNAGTPGMKDALHKLMQERWPGEFVENSKWKLAETGEIVDCKQFGSAIPSYNDPKLFDIPVSGETWVLCGDAAGHVNPIHGEGLNHSVLGGRLAAKAVSKEDPTLFEKYWRSHYSRDMYRAASTKHKIYRSFFMRIGFALGRTPAMYGMLASLTRGDYEGKATRSFWVKLPLALLQATFGMKHKALKAIT
jgi:flavin-dependent dehydrogenase